MEISVNTDRGASLVRIGGEMNIYYAGELKDGLMGALSGSASLDVDLSSVSGMDTSGLQLLLLARREAGKSGKPFRLVSASEAARSIIGLYNLSELFPECSGMEKA